MEPAALFLSIAALVFWILSALFAGDKPKSIRPGLGFGFSLIHLGAAIWATVRWFLAQLPNDWARAWLKISDQRIFEVKVALDISSVVGWLVLAIIMTVCAYVALIRGTIDNEKASRSELAATPLVGLGALIALLSGNLLVFYFGWMLTGFGGLLALALCEPHSNKRAAAALRFGVLNILPAVVFFAGTLGAFAAADSIDFSEINAKASLYIVPAWVIPSLLLGLMFRAAQIPFMQNARHAATAGLASLPVLFLSQAILIAAFFSKLYPSIHASEAAQYYAVIPLLSGLVASVLMLSEKEPSLFSAWLSTYLASTVFVSGLVGHYDATVSLGLSGTLAGFLFALAILLLDTGKPGTHWAVGMAALLAGGIPVGAWGASHYMEYVGLIHADPGPTYFQAVVLGLKLLTDLFVGMAIWTMAKERWLQRSRKSRELRWDLLAPIIVLGILCLGVIAGMRPLGGLEGPISVEVPERSFLSWFERALKAPVDQAQSAMAMLATQSDVIARILLAVVLILPALLVLLLFGRDEARLGDFRAFFQNLVARLRYLKEGRTFLWEYFLRPTTAFFGKSAAWVDSRVIDYNLSERWLTPVRWVRNGFRVIEQNVLDEKIVDGLAEAVSVLGRALRLVQNGQVQFYLAAGLLLLGALVMKFISFGGWQ